MNLENIIETQLNNERHDSNTRGKGLKSRIKFANKQSRICNEFGCDEEDQHSHTLDTIEAFEKMIKIENNEPAFAALYKNLQYHGARVPFLNSKKQKLILDASRRYHQDKQQKAQDLNQ